MTITFSRKPAERLAACTLVLRRAVHPIAVLSGALILSGCQMVPGSLATTDAFLSSPKASANQAGNEATAALERNRVLLDVQQACGAAVPTGDPEERPDLACGGSATSAHGRRAEAYRRWVEDEVRTLPAASGTAGDG